MALAPLDRRYLAREHASDSCTEVKTALNELSVFKNRAQAAWSKSATCCEELERKDQSHLAAFERHRERCDRTRPDRVDEAMSQAYKQTDETGEILERVNALAKLSQDIIKFSDCHIRLFSGSRKMQDLDDRIKSFKNERAKWEESGDRKRLSMLEMDVESMVASVAAIDRDQPQGKNGQTALRRPPSYSTPWASNQVTTQTSGAELEQKKTLLNNVTNRAQLICTQASKLIESAKLREVPYRVYVDRNTTEQIREQDLSCKNSIRYLERLLNDIAPLEHRLRKMQQLSASVASHSYSLKRFGYRHEMIQWKKDADLAFIKECEAQLEKLRKTIETLLMWNLSGNAGQCSFVPGDLPRYSTYDPLARND